MKNLFLVASPFQFLNAIEAKAHFSETDAVLVMLHSSDSQNNDQMMQMLDLALWEEVSVIASNTNIVTYLKAMRLLSALKASQTVWDKIFVGEFKSQTFQTFCRNLNAMHIFNLDDGVSTIELQRRVFGGATSRLAEDTGVRYVLKHMIKSLFALHENDEKEMRFDLYTCFDLEEHTGQTIVLNEYPYLSHKIEKCRIQSSNVYFYGSSISEKNIMRLEFEIELLGRARAYFEERGRKFLYIPHRLDSMSKLAEIRKLGIQVKPLGYAAEIEPLFSRELPGQISSFFSTALYTLGKIYRYEKIVAFRIPEGRLISRQEAISKLYEEYEKHMTIVDL